MRLFGTVLAMLVAFEVHARPLPWPVASAVLAADVKAPAKDAKDDDDDEPAPAPAAKPGTAPATAKKDEKGADAKAAPAPAQGAIDESSNQQQLVFGAPLYNPNVAVHTVEKKQFSDDGLREVTLYPVALQANGKFTQYFGTAASFVWHFHENFGFQLSGQFNWVSVESGFNAELIEKAQVEAESATSLLWVWGALGGVEVTPLYGKFAWFENSLAHFSFVLNGGLGVGGTRHQLKPSNKATGGATYGNTGLKFLAQLGGGFRLQLGDRFALRLEIRDVVYTARVDSVNGCSRDDMRTLFNASNMGTLTTPGSVNVTGGCNVESFFDSKTNQRKPDDIKYANDLVSGAASDVLNNLGFYAGFSVLF